MPIVKLKDFKLDDNKTLLEYIVPESDISNLMINSVLKHPDLCYGIRIHNEKVPMDPNILDKSIQFQKFIEKIKMSKSDIDLADKIIDDFIYIPLITLLKHMEVHHSNSTNVVIFIKNSEYFSDLDKELEIYKYTVNDDN